MYLFVLRRLSVVVHVLKKQLNPPPAGLSVCLRYLTEGSAVFTLDPSGRAPLRLEVSGPDQYRVTFDRYRYYSMDMRPHIRFWSDMRPDFWTGFCLSVDTAKNVAQVFRGPNMSIRKILPVQVRTEKLVWYFVTRGGRERGLSETALHIPSYSVTYSIIIVSNVIHLLSVSSTSGQVSLYLISQVLMVR